MKMLFPKRNVNSNELCDSLVLPFIQYMIIKITRSVSLFTPLILGDKLRNHYNKNNTHSPGKEPINFIFIPVSKYTHWIYTISEFQSQSFSIVHHLPELIWEIGSKKKNSSCKKSQYTCF